MPKKEPNTQQRERSPQTTQQQLNTYGGMNRDLSFDSIPNNLYIDGKDVRITTSRGESTGSITNIEGNTYSFSIPQSPTDGAGTGTRTIIGTCSIRNYLILFCADDSDTNGWIYYVEYDPKTGHVNTTCCPRLVYNGNGAPAALKFSRDWPIEAIGRYESGDVTRIYWTDYKNDLRSLELGNLSDPCTYSAITTDISLISVFPNVDYTAPILTNIGGGGNLPVGEYQFAYRLTTFDGKETLISPPGVMIHVVSESDTTGLGSRTAEYMGDPKGTITDKSIEITIDTTDYKTKFETAELIAVFYEEYTSIPVINSIEKKTIGSAANSLSFTYTGFEAEITTITSIEFAIKVYPFSTVKTLTSKDNSLVVANIKETKFDIQARLTELGETFDPLALRYDSSSQLPTAVIDPATSPPAVYTAEQQKFNVPYNEDKHWMPSWHERQQFKFKQNGTTLGGQSAGLGVSYKFVIKDYEIDSSVEPGFVALANTGPNADVDLGEGYSYPSNSFVSAASPYISGLLRGYKRGDTYRFGIIFYNKKGETSFVEYIGDIKFPDISEYDDTTNASLTNYWPTTRRSVNNPAVLPFTTDVIYGNFLGIEFTLDFTNCPNFKSEIGGYQIVRVKREDKDKRRVCSGFIKSYQYHDDLIENPPGFSTQDYNFKTPDDTNLALHQFYITKTTTATGSTAIGKLNGTFYALNNNEQASLGLQGKGNTTYGWTIYGNYFGFYSPEVAYDFNGPNNDSLKGASSALLITGCFGGRDLAYADDHSPRITPTSGTIATGDYNQLQSGSDLNNPVPPLYGPAIFNAHTYLKDTKRKYRAGWPIDRGQYPGAAAYGKWDGIAPNPIVGRGCEYVKQIAKTEKADFVQDVGIVNKDQVYGPFPDGSLTEYYMRNYIADCLTYTLVGTTDTNLNRPEGNNGVSWIASGTSCMLGNFERFFTDPLNNDLAIPAGERSSQPSFESFEDLAAVPIKYSYVTPLGGGTASPIWANPETSTPIVDWLIPRKEIYGGLSDSAVELNTFVPCSAVVHPPVGATITFKVFGGDIFISMHEQQWGVINRNVDKAYYDDYGTQNAIYRYACTETINIPLETTINIDLAYGNTVKRGVKFAWGPDTGPSDNKIVQFRQETNNLAASGGGSPYAKVLDMYNTAYNTVYSRTQMDSGLVYIIKPIGAELTGENDIRAYLSNVKINGELLDSWSKFLVSNYYDVEAQFGPINKILNWRDQVFFFQDIATGMYSINPRAVTSTTDGIPTQLGTGQGFQHHNYVSTENGSIHQWAIKATDTGIYYLDATHKKIFMLSQANNPLSEIKGLHGFLNNLNGDVLLRKAAGGDNPINFKGVNVTRDMINDEVLFSFHGLYDITLINEGFSGTYYRSQYAKTIPPIGESPKYYLITATITTTTEAAIIAAGNLLITDDELIEDLNNNKKTLVYDELAKQFSSFYSAVPNLYIENGNILLSPKDTNTSSSKAIYIHNSGDYGKFYDVVKEASVTLVINPDADINKVLRFIEFGSQVKDAVNTISRAETITAFRVQTEYQDTTKTAFSANTVKRRFDKWRVKLPRDQKSASKRGRLRSTHFILTLYYDNTYNKELILNRVMSHYDIQVY